MDLGGYKFKKTIFELESGEIVYEMKTKGPFYRPVLSEDRCVLDNVHQNVPEDKRFSEYLKFETASFLEESGCSISDIDGAGFSVKGVVFNDGKDGQPIIFICDNAPRRFTVKDRHDRPHIKATDGLMEMFPVLQVIGGNDGNCTGNAQSFVYEQRGIDPLKTFYIIIGEGFGGGGPKMDIDEIGHTKIHGIIPELRIQCDCGEWDCIDAYASGSGMPNFASKFLKLYDESPETLKKINEYERLGGKLFGVKDIMEAVKSSKLRGIGDLRAEHIFGHANIESDKGDEFARYMIKKFADMTGYVISGLANIHGVEVFGLGSGVAINNPEYVEMINHSANSLIGKESKILPKGITVELSPLGGVANDYGAASLVLPPEHKPEWVKTMVKLAEEKSRKV